MGIRDLARALALLPALTTLTPGALAQNVLRPSEGQVLNRLHARFRWPDLEAPLLSDWFLHIVEDDGSADPFLGGNTVVLQPVSGDEPRTIVTEGLDWGRRYAWRTYAIASPAPGRRFASAIHRFETLVLPTELPPVAVTIPPGAGAIAPGVTMFNWRHGNSMSEFVEGYAVAVDETGKYVYCFVNEERRVGDIRQLPNGRLLWVMGAPQFGIEPGRMVESTLDGRRVDVSPRIVDELHVHHEALRLPNGNPLLLLHESRVFPGLLPSFWGGDRIAEYDRHTWIELKSWSVFDHYSVLDFEQQQGAGNDWTHGNAATYDAATNSVYFSARHLSRITRIDWSTLDVVYNLGKHLTSNDDDFGDNFFSYQHAPEVLPNGNILLFNNGNLQEPLSAPRQSSAVEITFDSLAAPTTASIFWEYELVNAQGAPVYAPFLGDADRLPNGNTLICAGPTNLLQEVDSGGNLVWSAQFGPPFPVGSIYRSERIEQLVLDTPGDIDDDQDLDLHELAALQNGFGLAPVGGFGFPARLSDIDSDGDLDAADMQRLVDELTGPSNEVGVFPLE